MVKGRLGEAVAAAIAVLRQWGIECLRRDTVPGRGDLTGPAALEIHAYETGRPFALGKPPCDTR